MVYKHVSTLAAIIVVLTVQTIEARTEATCDLVVGGTWPSIGKLFLRESQYTWKDPKTGITRKDTGVKIEGRLFLKEFADGEYGFHIHQNPALGNNCTDAGPHFNPQNMSHGAPEDHERHVGDLGNIFVKNNEAAISITDNKARLNGPNHIINRAIVLHRKKDDLGRGDGDSKKTGNAGSRYACCVIRLEKERV